MLRMEHRGQPHLGRFGKESKPSAPHARPEGCCTGGAAALCDTSHEQQGIPQP